MKRNAVYANLHVTKFRNYLSRLDRETKKAAILTMKESLKELRDEIKSRIPEDTRTLKKSFSSEIKSTSSGVTAIMGFGIKRDETNPKTGLKASQYVVAVHEDLKAAHPRGGSAKFMEIPVREFQGRFAEIATLQFKRGAVRAK